MIKFERIRWKNILSTGNFFTEIEFTKSSNTLIVGANGSGKSTLLDALCFVLFGKPYRKINKPNLLNSINQSHGVVEVEFTIGKKQYKVIRGLKPNIFQIILDGELINQDAANKDYQELLEKSILKLNYKSFTQIVILGSASFTPFMQLSAADRRGIIEDLLDIQIFSAMNVLVKQKLVTLKDENLAAKYESELTEEKIKLQLHNLEEHRAKNDKEIDKKRAQIEESQYQIDKLNSDIALIQKHIDILDKKVSDKLTSEKKSKKLIQLESKIESNIKRLMDDIKFYEENDDCPTCRQNLDSTFKAKQIEDRKAKESKQKEGLSDIQKEILNVSVRLGEIQDTMKHINAHQSEIIKHNSTIKAINAYIKQANEDILELSDMQGTLEQDNSKLRELNEKLNELMQKRETLANEKQYYDFASTLLKDTGIKTKIIKQYLPIMNKLINKYLSAMDSFINFNLNENFEEQILSRHRDDFSYHNFSEGEKIRIDLAILFTWRQIAKMKNSVNTNLLILDEVFDSSLDTGGTEEFLKLMYEIGNDTNVFVISHKGDQLFDKFHSVIKFEKVNNFSRIMK